LVATALGVAGVAETESDAPPATAAMQAHWRQVAGLEEKTAAPIRCGSLIVWNTGRGVHAVRIADGRHPWKDAPNATDSLIFPRGVSSRALLDRRAARQMPLPPFAAGARVLAVIDGLSASDDTADTDDTAALVCLDMSPAAEGRLAWIAAPPRVVHGDGPPQPTSFAGPPTADANIVVCVVRSRTPSDWLHLVAFDARDGQPIWTRPLGSAIAADGVDHAPRGRIARLQDERIIVNTQAGSVVTFDRDGRLLNTAPVAAAQEQEAP